MVAEFRRGSILESHGARREPGTSGAFGPTWSEGSAVPEGWRAGVPAGRMTAKEAASLAPERMTAKEAAGLALQRRAASPPSRAGVGHERGEPGRRAATGVPGSTAGRAMPEAVQRRMEGAFGADFSDVRVHPGSARAVALGAVAYTQGSNIHMAPGHWAPETGRGQELLGHELAHVVQQREGRVRATAQMEGVALNDEPALEREADVLARRAVDVSTEPAQRRTTAGAISGVIQRNLAWNHERSDTQLDSFVGKLDELVNQAAQTILTSPRSIEESDGYLTRWKATVTSFVDKFQESKDLAAAKKEERFIYSAYGYAVESLTNLDIKNGALKSHLPDKFNVSLQATRGHTRPDVVVKNGEGTDVGWFDITASMSETHIKDKTGSGWTTHDYVAEVTYPSLDDTALMTLIQNALKATVSSEELERLREVANANRQRRDTALKNAATQVTTAIKNVESITNMANRAKAFEEQLAKEFDIEQKLLPRTAKGVLAEVATVLGEAYSKLAGSAGYKGDNQRGLNREAAQELIYG